MMQRGNCKLLGYSENFKHKMSNRVIHQNSSKEYIRDAFESLTSEKHLSKFISQQGFVFTKLPKTIVVCYILPSSFKLKISILTPLTI